MSALRNVTITVSSIPTGNAYLARSYPHDDYNNNGKMQLYRVPVYNVLIQGTDAPIEPSPRHGKQ